MSATALRDPGARPPREPPAGRGPAAMRATPAAPRPPGRRRDGTLWLRLAACAALAVFGAQAWADMVLPAEPGRLVGAALAGVVLGAGALLLGHTSRRTRRAGLAALVLAGVAAALLLAGVSGRLFGPKVWDDLLGGLGQGIQALPGLSVPYRGVDEWNRIALLLGGTLLAIAGPLVACWPARGGRVVPPVVPAIILAVLYAVPAVQFRADHPWLDGALFALLLAAVLFTERLAVRELPVAAAVLGAAVLAGAALAPQLDAREPWIDYEELAQSLGERGTSAFSWEHAYGPLDWPRDGREVLRVKADRGAYWKATTLADFDGLRWREVAPGRIEDDPEAVAPRARWVQDLRVSVRNLRTRQFVAAGTTLRIDRSPRKVAAGAPGSYVAVGAPLRRGNAYLARAYVPRPTRPQLEAASTDFPDGMWPYLSMRLPERIGGPPAQETAGAQAAIVVFGAWSSDLGATLFNGSGYGDPDGEGAVLRSRYGRLLRLSQRLRARSSSPYDYVRRVIGHFRRGFSYSEQPPARPVPLDAFVFDDRIGYCQQFSGAMTLMLRMGGIPARVAAGFTPGTRDRERGEYVVRDIDAHSWVEAYFPSYGWVTFDPTPAVAPPRSQAAGADEPAEPADEEEESGSESSPAGDRTSDPQGIDSGAAGGGGDGGPPIVLLVLAGLLAAGGVALAVLVARGRRRFAEQSPEAAVRELERALRRSGRHPAGGLTLRALEERLRGAPPAAGYVQRVRAARFGFDDDRPTLAQRRALRRELGAGLGLRGRLRALWALPPW